MARGTETEDEDIARTLATICRRLRQLRLARGLTVQQTAWRCGVERSNLSRLEAGRTNVSVRMLCRLCKALDTDIWTLFDRRDDAVPDS